MFKNIHTKNKILINMLLAQLGFTTITTVAILSNSQVAVLITINLVFAVIIAYTNYAAYKRIGGGIERLKRYMNDIMDFAFMRVNKIDKAQYMKNDEIGMILTELNGYVEQFDTMRKEDMKVLGEVVLTLDKMSQGIYKCRIHAKSHNFMLEALKETLNKALNISEKIC